MSESSLAVSESSSMSAVTVPRHWQRRRLPSVVCVRERATRAEAGRATAPGPVPHCRATRAVVRVAGDTASRSPPRD